MLQQRLRAGAHGCHSVLPSHPDAGGGCHGVRHAAGQPLSVAAGLRGLGAGAHEVRAMASFTDLAAAVPVLRRRLAGVGGQGAVDCARAGDGGPVVRILREPGQHAAGSGGAALRGAQRGHLQRRRLLVCAAPGRGDRAVHQPLRGQGAPQPGCMQASSLRPKRRADAGGLHAWRRG